MVVGRLPIALALLTLLTGCSEPAPAPRNVLIISIDTLVPGRMSLYGGPRETTPHIDRFARLAVRFDNAFSTAPWTMPAHASMLTGLYPLSISADPRERDFYRLAPMLAERFQQGGYATGAITGGGYMSRFLGIDAGFDSFEEVGKDAGVDLPVARLVDWLQTHRDRRFFFFFHTFAAHEPLTDRRYVTPGSGGRLREIYRSKKDRSLHFRACCTSMDVTQDELEFMLALYDGGVATADEMVGKLIEALETLSLLDSTDIIITSDHGQEFWQHTRRGGHGQSLYQELLRIPLIWYQPGMKTRGSVQTADVSLIDIVPTLVARFGLETSDRFDGVDLGPMLNGDEWNVVRPLFAESIHYGPERFSVWTQEAKLTETPDPSTQLEEMRFGGGPNPVPVAAPTEMFLRDDRLEQNNVASSARNSDLLAGLRESLASHRASAPASTGEPQDPEIDTRLDPRVVEELRALGYVE